MNKEDLKALLGLPEPTLARLYPVIVKYRKVVVAYIQGRTVQIELVHKWNDIKNPSFNSIDVRYRIKPSYAHTQKVFENIRPGHTYYYINSCGLIMSTHFSEHLTVSKKTHELRLAIGNCFYSAEKALAAAKEIWNVES